MKVLAVSGSPRMKERSSTLKLVETVAQSTGLAFDLVSLAGKKSRDVLAVWDAPMIISAN